MKDPLWIKTVLVNAIHMQQITEHGGLHGVRDPALLASALSKPVNAHAYGQGDLFDLAAAYAYGLVKNHPFVDGNKRVAFVACEVFLIQNGYGLLADDAECVVKMLALAAGELSEAEFAAWLRSQSEAH